MKNLSNLSTSDYS
jgi:hypothetical protein